MDPMILSFLLIGGSIIVLILLLHNQNRYGRREKEETEQEIQNRKVAKAFNAAMYKGSRAHRESMSHEEREEYDVLEREERDRKLKEENKALAKARRDKEKQDKENEKLLNEKLNYTGGWEKHDSLPLDKALEIGVPYQKCFVYKLSVGGSDYIGFTTQKPKKRLEQHLNSAKEGSGQKVHVALRRFGYLHEFEVISEHENEILGLVDEIINIKKHSAELNTSIGGEGNFFLVAEKESYQGEEIFFVEKNYSAEKEQVQKGKSRKAQKKHTQTEKSDPKKTRTKKSYDFAVGDEVFHKKFGIGNIMSISPSETLGKNVLEIQFNEVGYKRISEEFVVLSDLPF